MVDRRGDASEASRGPGWIRRPGGRGSNRFVNDATEEFDVDRATSPLQDATVTDPAEQTNAGNEARMAVYHWVVAIPTLAILVAYAVTHPQVFAHPTLLVWVVVIAAVDMMPIQMSSDFSFS